MTLAAGTVYDVCAIGLLEDESITLLPLTTTADASDFAEEVHQMPSTGVGADAKPSNQSLLLAAALTLLSLVTVVLGRFGRSGR